MLEKDQTENQETAKNETEPATDHKNENVDLPKRASQETPAGNEATARNETEPTAENKATAKNETEVAGEMMKKTPPDDTKKPTPEAKEIEKQGPELINTPFRPPPKRHILRSIFLLMYLVAAFGGCFLMYQFYKNQGRLGTLVTYSSRDASNLFLLAAAVLVVNTLFGWIILTARINSSILALIHLFLHVVVLHSSCLSVEETSVHLTNETFEDVLLYTSRFYEETGYLPTLLTTVQLANKCCGWGLPQVKTSEEKMLFPKPYNWSLRDNWPAIMKIRDFPKSCCKVKIENCGKDMVTDDYVHSGYVKVMKPIRLEEELRILKIDYEIIGMHVATTLLCIDPKARLSMERAVSDHADATDCNSQFIEDVWQDDENFAIPVSANWVLTQYPTSEIFLVLDKDASIRKFQFSKPRNFIYIYEVPYKNFLGEKILIEDPAEGRSTFFYHTSGLLSENRMNKYIIEKRCEGNPKGNRSLIMETISHILRIYVKYTIGIIIVTIFLMLTFWCFYSVHTAEDLFEYPMSSDLDVLNLQHPGIQKYRGKKRVEIPRKSRNSSTRKNDPKTTSNPPSARKTVLETQKDNKEGQKDVNQTNTTVETQENPEVKVA